MKKSNFEEPWNMHEQLNDAKEISSAVNRKVRVKGITEIASEDAILYYFENRRRSGGGDVKDIVFNYEEDIAEIIFENAEDAIAVTKKDHTISGKQVEVTLCTVPNKRPLYDDKVLIKGLKEEISDECLIYFLEAKAGIKTKTLAYHKEREDVVLVTSYSQIDFTRLKNGNQKFILEGATIEFFPVEVTDCIYVEHLPKDVSEDFVEIYFDNTKRSNGGPVRHVELFAGCNSCLVCFDDYAVVDSVLEKKHRLSDQILEVRKFYECVRSPEEENITVSPAIVICEMNIEKLKFVQETHAYKTKLENKLDTCHGKIDWSELDGERHVLKINCTADTKSLKSNRFQIRWRQRVKQIFEKVMDKIGVYKKQLKSSEVKICLETIRNINGAADIQCDFDEEKGMVIIVGNSSAVNLASKYIDVIITAHEQGIEYTKLRVVFSSEAEINLIKKLEKFTQLKMDFPDVKVHIDRNECIVELEGSANEVSGAKMILCDAKNALITVFSDTLPRLSAKLYTLPQTIDFISEGLKRKDLIASWCVSDQRLIICCPFKEVLDKTVNTIRSAVVQNDILTSPESASVTETDIWSEKMKEWDEMCHGRVIVSLDDSDTGSKKIEVYATADLAPKLSYDIAGILAKESEKSDEKKEPDYSLGSEEDSQARTTTILVSNLPANITEEFLKNFFEDRSHETENVLEVKVNSKNNEAIVKFKDNNAVEYVLRRKHKLCGKGLKVGRCHGFPDMTVGNFVSPALVTSDTQDVEKKYQSSDESSEDGSSYLYRETQRLLARLTKNTFQTVVSQMQALPIKSETELNKVVEIIFEKAISDDQNRCLVYANLCRCFSVFKVPSDSRPGEMVNFRGRLLTLCQKEFERNRPSELKIAQKKDGDGRKDSQRRAQINLRQAKEKQRSLGNIRFFGELFKFKMLTENIMHDCICKLLSTKDSDDLECLCTLLTTIGKELDVGEAKPRMDQYFQRVASTVNNKTTPPYIKIILQNVIDLRMNMWKQCCTETSSTRR